MSGKRFRELDLFIGSAAERWIRRNVKGEPSGFKRATFATLPEVVRIAILQRLVIRHAGKSPNERLLGKLDDLVRSGKPSSRIRVGKQIGFRNSYDRVTIVHEGPESETPNAGWAIDITRLPAGEEGARVKQLILSGDRTRALFDLAAVAFPLTVSPLVAGDTIIPFGGTGSRKAKEIMIDLKIPREARWGRTTVRDADGKILWIPGVVRSNGAPVSDGTRRLLCLTARPL